MFLPILFIIVGLGVLILGAEGLVQGASSIAKKAGISPLVIGLTVVAFGTSAPELIVNLFSAFNGSSEIAIGNIVGSNIANIFLILGISAIIYPITVKKSTVWKEIPFALLAMILVYTMGNDVMIDGTSFNAITRTDGLSLISIFIIFMFYTFGISKNKDAKEAEKVSAYSWPISTVLTIAGLVFLFFGGKILIDNAITLAHIAGLSETLIGLTIVAIGTSLPELATSLVAAFHRQSDIAIGNIIGSNIFNVFWVLGLTSTILQLPFNSTVNFDVLIGVAAITLLFLFMFVGSRRKLDRWQGILFVCLYISYTIYLIQRG